MQTDKKSKKNNSELLRKILDNISSEDLSPKDEKYLRSLSKRLQEPSEEIIHKKVVSKDDSKKEIESLKPRVTIYPREEKKVLGFTEMKEEAPEPEIEEAPAVPPISAREIEYEDEDVFEVEKVEVPEPEFIKVKPKETAKPEKEETLEEKKALADEELTEWEAVEKPTEKEKLPEWEPYDEGELKEKPEEIIEEKTAITPESIEDKEKLEGANNFCPQCGAKLKHEANFCSKCGNKIITDEEESKIDEFELVEEIEPAPTFIPVKKIEEKEKKEISEEPSVDRDSKIEAFKDIKSIKDKTAVLLYDNGYTTIDSLTSASLKDLTKIKGIKRNTAKRIKKEIKQKSELELVKIKDSDTEEVIEKKENEFLEIKPTTIEKPKEEKVTEEEIELKDEIIEREVKIEAFKDMESIDDETAILLYDSGFITTDTLKEANLKDLTKIKGIKRKQAKNIKKEIEKKIEEAAKVKPIAMGETAEGEITENQVQKEDEAIEKEEDLPSPVELSAKSSEWSPVIEGELEEKEIPEEEPSIDKDCKIEAFKDIKSINDETAVLLYDNGYTTIDSLTIASLRDLTKIKGIKRNTAKRIKKEIKQKSELELVDTETEEPEKEDKFIIDEEKSKKDEVGEIDEKILEYEPIESEEEVFEEEEEVEDIPFIKVDEEDVFNDIKSIDEKIAKLLKENGINSIYDLRNTAIKELTKIKGIKRKIAKQIKKEAEEVTADRYAKEIASKETFERGKNPLIREEDEDEWESFDEDKISESRTKEIKGFRHGDYTLYVKEIETKSGKKRTVRFFSKAEPEGAEPIELPKGYKVGKNKKTGLPYLKKKK